MTVEAALHGDRLRDVDAAGAGIGVEVEVGVADDATDRAAARTQLSARGGSAGRREGQAAAVSPLPVLALRGPGGPLGRVLPLPVSALTSPGPVCWSSISPDPVP